MSDVVKGMCDKLFAFDMHGGVGYLSGGVNLKGGGLQTITIIKCY